jgi:hypothetical protein
MWLTAHNRKQTPAQGVLEVAAHMHRILPLQQTHNSGGFALADATANSLTSAELHGDAAERFRLLRRQIRGASRELQH